MGILAWLIIGGVAGWLASMVMKTNAKQGTLIDIVVGIVGAMIGGFLLGALGLSSGDAITGFNIPSLATAFIGAVVLIGILKAVRR